MHATRSIAMAVLLCGGCGGPPRGASSSGAGAGDGAGAGAGAGDSGGGDPTAPQSVRAAAFPTARTHYYCQWVEDKGYTAEKAPTPIEITPKVVKVYATGGNSEDFTEYPLASGDAAYVIARDEPDAQQRSVVLGDSVVYMLTEEAGAEAPEITLACAPQSEHRRITDIGPAVHRERLKAYAETRMQAWLATAGDDVALGDLDLGDLSDVNLDDDGEGGKDAAPRWTAEQAAQIARARTMVSFTFEASATKRNEHISLVVVATLADGTKMRIGRGDPIFPALFGFSRAGAELGTMVDVWPLDEDGAEIKRLRQYKEIAYSLDGGSYSLHCVGEPGLTGLDQNWNDHGMLFRHGQRGGRGPNVTIEITTVSPSRPDVLRFRLRCGGKEKVFNGGASTEVTVSTVGGKGGHGIPKPNGDGSNGGDGGDGGDITVLVDPSVSRYTLRHGSRGGKGGKQSESKGWGKGNPGRNGSEGSFDERRQPVTIP